MTRGATIRIGTRGSALALAQTTLVKQLLGGDVTIVEIVTSGDRDPTAVDKSRWTNALEEALLADEIDIAVHSAKDVPGEIATGCELVATPTRANPSDALIGATSLEALPEGAVVGTSALRRRAQLAELRADLEIQPVRGNVDTRLRHLHDGKFDALILAGAGLERLGCRDEIGMLFDPEVTVPAAGQGTLVLEIRADDFDAHRAAQAINDPITYACLMAERALVHTLESGCDTSVGAYARVDGDEIVLSGYIGLPDGSAWLRDRLGGSVTEPAEVGTRMAQRLLSTGAGDLLIEAQRQAQELKL